jgi:hypothetical protein
MNEQKSIRDYRIDACEAAAQASLYSAHPGSRFYSDQASFAARCAMKAQTVQQAKRYAKRAAEMAAKAKLMAPARPRKPWHQVKAEADELFGGSAR